MRLAVVLLAVVLVGAIIPAASARTDRKELVTVLGSGSTDEWVGGIQHFGYGVVLHNRSATRDALGVQVHVAVLSRNGAVIGIYLTTVPRVPAGATFYLGNEPATIGNTQHAAGIIVGIASSGTQVRHGPLPSGTAHVDGTRIVGSVSNTSGRTLLTKRTKVFAVYYDRSGKVIGGTRLQVRFPQHPTIAAHTSASFTAGPGASVAAGRIAGIRVSVVPTYAG